MHAVRLILTCWVVKYNSYFTVPIVLWNYYSICYKDYKWFAKYPPFMIIPVLAVQLLGTKIVNIPFLVDPQWKYVKKLENFGCYPYILDSSINELWEYVWMLFSFLFVCLTYKMCQYLPLYHQWEKEQKVLLLIIKNLG